MLDELRPLAWRGSRSVEIEGVTCDSRKVRPGFLFAAIPGHDHDGARFAREAVQRGASVILAEAALPPADDPESGAFVQVDHVRLAFARAARRFHGDPAARLLTIGVTGTNGKTTVAWLLREILRDAGRRPGLLGTIHHEFGSRRIPAARTTPDAGEIQALLAEMEGAGCGSVVMEVSSHALDQHRVEGIDFDAAVFTNLTRDHLDYHLTMERYFEAKARLFAGLGAQSKPAVAVIPRDEAWGRLLIGRTNPKVRIVTYGWEEPADVQARSVALGPAGSAFTLSGGGASRPVTLQLMGRFNVLNALAALACAGSLGLDLDQAAESVARVVSVPGRLERIENDRGIQIFVDYAHTDDALVNVLATLREVAAGRLIVVFGCGGERDRGKRPRMGAAAGEGADYSIITSDNPRREDPGHIIEHIAAGFPAGASFEKIVDRREAIRRALAVAGPADTLLIAGKGHESVQEFRDVVAPFDDRQVVRELLAGGGATAAGRG
jgi:UDP-N-acetylmuramoyl-L-alanyl-D-glutamate--2,6-diaminopimelate ligase